MCDYNNGGIYPFFDVCYACKKDCPALDNHDCNPEWKGETDCHSCVVECPDRVEGYVGKLPDNIEDLA